MTRTLSLFLTLTLALLALPASAWDLGGGNVLIPVAGRALGAYGTQWRTDLVVTNLEAEPLSIHVTFLEANDSSFTTVSLPANGTVTLEDVIYKTLSRDATTGMLRVNSAHPGARFVARAYVYNRGNAAGEYGQGIAGIPIDALGQEHTLSGIGSGNGRRTNVGIANPWPSAVDVVLAMLGPNGELLAQDARTVEALKTEQINDVFASLGVTPRDGVSVRVFSSLPVYPYASIVRNDTGDAVFVPGTGVRLGTSTINPQCSDPAALLMPYRDEAPSEVSAIILKSATDFEWFRSVALPEAGVTAIELHPNVPAVTAKLTPQQIAKLRCEGTVKSIRRDGAVDAN